MPINPVIRLMKGLPQNLYSAEGLMYQDWNAITPCQRACTTRFGIEVQREQEDYLAKHPEILAMLKIFIAKVTKRGKRKDLLTEAALHFTRPFEELDEEVRTFLESPAEGPYVNQDDRQFNDFDELDFITDLSKIIIQHYPPEPWVYHTPVASIPNTPSSSFISIQTSEFTLPTPEPVPTPEPTTSQVFYNIISNTVDKVIYVKVDERALLYDTAYVELMKAVEEAMEIPVIDIRVDIANLFHGAYHMFEVNIMEKEAYENALLCSRCALTHKFLATSMAPHKNYEELRNLSSHNQSSPYDLNIYDSPKSGGRSSLFNGAAEIAWQKRMRKKLKKTLRRQKNFKGYETPPTPKSEISSHESYKRPPPRPCECQPLANYNRYGKDRFGIYLPADGEVYKKNVTTTPDCVSVLENEGVNDEKAETPKTTATNKSTGDEK